MNHVSGMTCRSKTDFHRILAAWYRANEDSSTLPDPGFGMPFAVLAPSKRVNARNSSSSSTIFQAAVEGHVLVKNVNNSLPLKCPQLLSLFGYDAIVAPQSNPSSFPLSRWSEGYESINLTDLDLIGVFTGSASNLPNVANKGTIIVGGGSGANNPPYISAPYDAFLQQAITDGTYLLWDFESNSPSIEPTSDACIVFINQFASEGFDRTTLSDSESDQLINNVAGTCNNTIVVIHNAGIRVVDAWIDHPNVTAVIFGHLPGQDSGRALVEIMYGKQSPSGRLPYTVAKQESDYGSLLSPSQPGSSGSMEQYFPQSNFTEGVYIDYKHFLANKIAPRFEFGFGLTYSSFKYTNLQLSCLTNTSTSTYPPKPDNSSTAGGNPALFNTIATVGCSVANVGGVAAPEVVQVYVGIPNAPERQLRGFTKVMLQSNASASPVFSLTRRDLSVWDVTHQDWMLQSGTYNVYVGASVLDIRLNGTFTIGTG